MHQMSIPPDHVAYQLGEAMQIHSGGLLRATPHSVQAPRPELARGVTRNTFAVFMQPRWDCPMDLPPWADAQQVGVGQWAPGVTFGAFSEHTLAANYKQL